MFKKYHEQARIYKKKTDWEAIFAVIFWCVVGLAILGAAAG